MNLKTFAAFVGLMFGVAVFAAAPTGNIPISQMPISTNAIDTAYLPIIQPYPGRFTNDNFRITATNLFRNRSSISATNITATTIYASNLFVTNIYGTVVTNVFTTYTNNFFTNLYVTNFYSSNVTVLNNSYASNLYAANITIGNSNFFNPNQFTYEPAVDNTVHIKSGALVTNLVNAGTITLGGIAYTMPGALQSAGVLYDPTGSGTLVWTNSIGSFSGQVFTNSAGNIYAVDSQNSMQITNLFSFQTLNAMGAFITPNQAITALNPGTNVLNPFGASMFYLISSDPSTVVELTTGNGAGSHIWIINVTTNSTFTIFSGPLNDDPSLSIFVRGGSWTPTEIGESIEFLGVPGGWIEQGRANPNGTAPGTINPTDNYIPYRYDASTFLDSPIVVVDPTTVGVDTVHAVTLVVTNLSAGGLVASLATDGLLTNIANAAGFLTNNGSGGIGWASLSTPPTYWTNISSVLRPTDLTLQPMVKNGWFAGTNSQTLWGSALNGGESLVSMHRPSLGDPNWNEIWISSTMNGGFGAGSSFFDVNTRTNQVQLSIGTFPTAQSHSITLTANSGESIFGMISTNATGVSFRPAIADGSTPFRFNSTRTHTTGNLLEAQNNGTNQLALTRDGGLVLGPNSDTLWGGVNLESLIFLRSSALGDSPVWKVAFGATSGTDPYASSTMLYGQGTDSTTSFQVTHYDSGGLQSGVRMAGGSANELAVLAGGQVKVDLYPDQVDGSPPFFFYSSTAHTTGNMVEVKNNATTILSVPVSGAVDETLLYLWDVTAGSLVRVSRGASDSGGAGFRVLRIPN